MIYDDYVSYTREYRAAYPRALVLMEVGSFWELYNCDENLGAPVEAVCDLCNIQYTRKDKKLPLSGKNPMMAGFPSLALRKFLPVLVDDGYTVVLVSQVSPPPNPRRAVTDVISSSTFVASEDMSTSSGDPHLVSLFLETVQDWKSKKPMLMIGVAMLELSTGSARVAECASKPCDYANAYDTLYRLFAGVLPAEVVVHSAEDVDLRGLASRLELDCVVHDRCGAKFDKTLVNIKHQNDILKRVFACESMLSPLEELDMERTSAAALALVGALRFVEHHNVSLLKSLKRPIDVSAPSACELCFNTARQLHVYSKDTKEKTLEKVLNRCVTAMGKRYFVRRLLYPFACQSDVENSLKHIDEFMTDMIKTRDVRGILRRVSDLERLFHRVEMGRCQLPGVLMIMESVRALDELGIKNTLHTFMSDTFDPAAGTEEELFREGVYNDIDELRTRMRTTQESLRGFVDAINKRTGEGYFKLEYNDREGHYIVGTAKRWKDADLKGIKHNGVLLSDLKAIPVSSSSSSVKLTHPKFKELSNECAVANDQLSTVFKDRWVAMQSHMASEFKTEFSRLVQQASELDFYTACALNAREFGYSRPDIKDGDSSYVKCKGLRHALLERVHDQVKYVENDVEVGVDTAQTGFLLYGLNSAGKSSLMKALGLCVIMAQAGMYVPCSDYESVPYNRVFTRITRGDDMLCGHSTFTVEMTELRNILKRSDKKSLVVGDELCAGTESVSGTSIVAAGVLQLLERETSFVLTTHLHGLMDLEVLRRQKQLGVYHLAVHYDDSTGSLIYDRKLTSGSGSSVYGLEVCRSLDMDPSFMALADEIRLSVQGEHVTPRTSKYNASVVVDTCSVCGAKAEEVHHIVPQAVADSDGMIGTFHKNASHNLVSLCSVCHDDVHAGKLRIDGYQQTSKGVKLQVVNSPMISSGVSKDVEKVVQNKHTEGMSFASIQRHVQASHGVRLSTYMIKKIVAHG